MKVGDVKRDFLYKQMPNMSRAKCEKNDCLNNCFGASYEAYCSMCLAYLMRGPLDDKSQMICNECVGSAYHDEEMIPNTNPEKPDAGKMWVPTTNPSFDEFIDFISQ